jgi:hypothetical protein
VSEAKYGIVTVCSRLVKACTAPDVGYWADILLPLAQSFSLSIAMDASDAALTEYHGLARAHPEIRFWLDVLNKKRGADWFVPVAIPDSGATGTNLYLAIFLNTVSDEKALLCASKQDYASHGDSLNDVLEMLKDKWQSIEYIKEFTSTRKQQVVEQNFRKPVHAVVIAENLNAGNGNEREPKTKQSAEKTAIEKPRANI